MKQAEEIQFRLMARDIPVTIVKAAADGDIEDEIIEKLSGCRLALIFGTEDYGEQGTVHESTRGELLYILDWKIPFFLIQMCKQFRDRTTCFRLPSSVKSYQLDVRANIEDALISEIVMKYHSIPVSGSTT